MDPRFAWEIKGEAAAGNSAPERIHSEVREIQRYSFAEAGWLHPGSRKCGDCDRARPDLTGDLHVPEAGGEVEAGDSAVDPRVVLQNTMQRPLQLLDGEVLHAPETAHPADRQEGQGDQLVDLQQFRSHQAETQRDSRGHREAHRTQRLYDQPPQWTP